MEPIVIIGMIGSFFCVFFAAGYLYYKFHIEPEKRNKKSS